MKISKRAKQQADELHQEAQRLSDLGQDDEALLKYQEAIAKNPAKAESFYNMGLIYKYRGQWQLSLDYNLRAHQLAPDDDASQWNLAIAATALRQWALARQVWQQCGIPLPDETGPIEMNLGITPIRLNPDDSGEVVWATRIDPVRARIDSVPYPESGFHYGDIVLHDGAPVGYREVDGRKLPVFNVLELFSHSNFRTFVVTLELSDEQDLDRLETLLAGVPHEIEDWTSNVRVICKRCSEGIPHDHGDDGFSQEFELIHKLGIAAQDQTVVEKALAKLQKQTGARLLSLEADKRYVH
jgi:TPR repeat